MRTYLWNAVWVRDDADDVVERQQRVTLDLGVDVLALGAAGEQLHEVDVVLERAVGVEAVPLAAHQVDQHREARLVVVEEQHVVAHVQQLQAPTHAPVHQLLAAASTAHKAVRGSVTINKTDSSPVVRKNRAAASTIKPRYRQKYF